jgi:hypothetical protein
LHNLIEDLSVPFSLVGPKLGKRPGRADTNAVGEYFKATREGFDEHVWWMINEFGRVGQRGRIRVAKAGGKRLDIETKQEFRGGVESESSNEILKLWSSV